MARPLRVQAEGATYHVTANGVAGQALYREDSDYEHFLGRFATVVERHGWSCHGYCLMTTHYHLVLYTPAANLAVGMKELNGAYAQGFNRRHGTRGHVLESRYSSRLVERESHVLEVTRYVALNPVRAGICADPGDWPWSSYGASVGTSPCPPFLTTGWLLAHFGANTERARKLLRDFILDGCERRRS